MLGGLAAHTPTISRRSTETQRLIHLASAATSVRRPVFQVLRVLQVPHVLWAEKDQKDLKDEKDLKDTRRERPSSHAERPGFQGWIARLLRREGGGREGEPRGRPAPAAFARR